MYLIMKAQGQLNSSVIYFSCVINPELYCGNARVSMYNRWCNLYIRQHKAFLRQGRNSGNSSILILTFLFCSFRESVCVSKWSNVQLFRLWIFRFPRNLDCSNLWSIIEIQINRHTIIQAEARILVKTANVVSKAIVIYLSVVPQTSNEINWFT